MKTTNKGEQQISFMEKTEHGRVSFVIDQYYETDEIKLWFLKLNGHLMKDLDVIEYSRQKCSQ